jgi:hypothetical protein
MDPSADFYVMTLGRPVPEFGHLAILGAVAVVGGLVLLVYGRMKKPALVKT